MSRAGEFDWIARHLAPLAGPSSFGLRDDAALIPVEPGHDLIVTQDAIAENIHFLSDDPLESVAQKALRVNISDIIAKGGTPFAYSMALGVPDHWEDHEMIRFCNGLRADQEQFAIKLNGGDTYRSPGGLCVSITMFGQIAAGRYVSRLGAAAGDLLFVTGTIGDAAVGLQVATGKRILKPTEARALLHAYRLPNPPFGIQEAVAACASAAMDISDGLVGDCRKLLKASSLAADVERDSLPLSSIIMAEVNSDPNVWQNVLAGGDDYQVLCTVPSQNRDEFLKRAGQANIQVTQIGKLRDGKPGELSLTASGMPIWLEVESYSHF